jgi:hypothetical protein
MVPLSFGHWELARAVLKGSAEAGQPALTRTPLSLRRSLTLAEKSQCRLLSDIRSEYMTVYPNGLHSYVNSVPVAYANRA